MNRSGDDPGKSGDQQALDIDWRRFASDALDLLCVANLEGYFLWTNERWTEVLGRSAEDLSSAPFLTFVHPDDVRRTAAEFERVIQGARTLRFVNRYLHGDRSVRWLDWTARCQPEKNLVYASARDVTNVREQAILDQTHVESLKLAEQVGSVGIWRVDLAEQTVHWSPEVYRIHGYEPNAFQPQLDEAINFYHPDDRAHVNAVLGEIMEKREPRSFEGLRIVRPDGSVRYVTSHGQVEVDPVTDEVAALYGVFVDTTESRALRARLDRAERLASLGTMAAGVAHEINNPLSLVRSNAYLIQRRLAEPRARQDLPVLVREIDDAARRIANIVSDLNDFARESEPSIAPVDLSRVVDAAIRLCRNEIRHKAELKVEDEGDLPRVCGDESKLTQVAVNLLVNAAQAIPADSASRHAIRVRFGTELRDDIRHGFFEVVDDGPGMTAEVMDKAFNPFFTTKPIGEGTGLGLAICHGIVNRLGGHLEGRSTPGEGTTMRVLLPVAPVENAEASADRAGESSTEVGVDARARILVIDDDEHIGRSTTRLLSDYDYDCEFEVDPSRALTRLRAGEDFDLIVCDLMMPNVSGPQVYRAIERDRPELLTRVLFVTGGAFMSECRNFLDTTNVPVLTKPFAPADLLKAIVAALDGVRGPSVG